MDHDVVVVGSINADLVLEVDRHPHPGETLLGRASSVLPGGKGANQAVAAARLGARVAMVGAVGTTPTPTSRCPACAGGGRSDGRSHERRATGLAVVTVADDGENTIVVIPGANGTVAPASLAAAAGTVRGARSACSRPRSPGGGGRAAGWHTTPAGGSC